MFDCRSVGKYAEVTFQYDGITIDMGLRDTKELTDLRNDLRLDIAQIEGFLPDEEAADDTNIDK